MKDLIHGTPDAEFTARVEAHRMRLEKLLDSRVRFDFLWQMFLIEKAGLFVSLEAMEDTAFATDDTLVRTLTKENR